jgi:hypothetical protein
LGIELVGDSAAVVPRSGVVARDHPVLTVSTGFEELGSSSSPIGPAYQLDLIRRQLRRRRGLTSATGADRKAARLGG